jgi:hypothetical protein
VRELEELEREAVRVARDEDDHDGGQRHRRLLATPLKPEGSFLNVLLCLREK